MPISTGPSMLAWGSLDSSAVVRAGSENFSVTWDEANRWFELNVPSASNSKDSMLLIITSVGNQSWDQLIATREVAKSGHRVASIKFVDVSRIVAEDNALGQRRRSEFHFVLYDLRRKRYN